MVVDVVNKQRTAAAARWTRVDNRVLESLRGSGFELLNKFNFTFHCNSGLLNILCGCYVADESVFIINGRKIAPTLDDVARILGLPIDGMAVSGKDPDDAETSDMSLRLLGDNSAELVRKSSLNLQYLLDHYMIVPPNEQDIDKYVRAYVLYITGTLLFPSKDAGSVPAMYLSVLEDISKIKGYAWGAAVLAHSFYQFRLATKRKATKSFTGNTLFFEIFVFEYFPDMIAVIFPKADLDLLQKQKEFPLAASYTRYLAFLSNDNINQVPKLLVQQALECTDIKWLPYKRLTEYLPDHLVAQLWVSFAHTIVHFFNIIEYYCPQKCCQKLALEVEDLKIIPPLPPASSRRRTSKVKYDYRTTFETQLQAWNKKRDFLITWEEPSDEEKELWNLLQESSARTEAPSLRELSNQLHDGESSARMHDGEPCASPQSEAPSLREPYNQFHDAELCARTEALSINPTLSPQQMNNNAQAQNRDEPQREEPEVTSASLQGRRQDQRTDHDKLRPADPNAGCGVAPRTTRVRRRRRSRFHGFCWMQRVS